MKKDRRLAGSLSSADASLLRGKVRRFAPGSLSNDSLSQSADTSLLDNTTGGESLDGGGAETDMDGAVADDGFWSNLALHLTEEEEQALVSRYMQAVEDDEESRKERNEQYAEGIRRTGLGKDAPGGADFDGASRVVHPLLAESCIDFEARQINHLFPVNASPVVPDLKPYMSDKAKAAAERVAAYMAWQVSEQIQECRPCTEKMLTQIPLAGDGYLKWYYSAGKNRPCVEFVPIDDVLLPYEADDFYTAQRVTHRSVVSEAEFESRVEAGIYRNLDYTPPEETEETQPKKATDKIEGKALLEYERHSVRTLLDIYCNEVFDFDKESSEKESLPYIITIDVSSRRICAIYRNWEEGDEYRSKINWLIDFPFLPWRGAQGIGLTHLIGSMSGAATGALRALLDSAHINNSPTLVTLKGTTLSGQAKRIPIGNVTEIQSRTGIDDLRKIMQPLAFNPPSNVLFELLNFVVAEARGVVRTTLDEVAEDNKNVPVGTKMAAIQEGMVVYSAIHARMFWSFRMALKTLHQLNRIFGFERTEQIEESMMPTEEDFELPFAAKPASDPSVFSETQKMGQLEFAMQMFAMNPALYDERQLHLWGHRLMNTPNLDKIMPNPEGPPDENQAAENIKMGMGQPATALPDQDHAAHLTAHADFLNAPLYGKNPMIAVKLIPQALEHMQQHLLFAYGDAVMEVLEAALGVTDIREVLSDEAPVTTALSQAISAASGPSLDALAQQPEIMHAMKAMMEAKALYDQLVPPPPPQVDPGILLAQAEMKKAEVKEKTDTQNLALEERRLGIEEKKTTFDQTKEFLLETEDLALRERKQDLDEFKAGANIQKGKEQLLQQDRESKRAMAKDVMQMRLNQQRREPEAGNATATPDTPKNTKPPRVKRGRTPKE